MTNAQPITISYNDLLKSDFAPIADSLEAAFGSSEGSLGILVVKDLPSVFQRLRSRCLMQAAEFAQLDEAVRDRYVDPSSKYSFGWSLGKEMFAGKPGKLHARHPSRKKLALMIFTQMCSRGHTMLIRRWISARLTTKNCKRNMPCILLTTSGHLKRIVRSMRWLSKSLRLSWSMLGSN